MLEMINAYGGLDQAKERFLTISNVVDDAAKAQTSWTNSLNKFYHTLDAGQKIAMSFMDGPGKILLEGLTSVFNVLVKLDDFAKNIGGSALSTAQSTLFGSMLLGNVGFKIVDIIKNMREAKKEANSLIKILNSVSSSVVDIDLKDNNWLQNFLGTMQDTIESSHEASKSVLGFWDAVSNFKNDKSLANFGKIFTTFNWQLIALSAAIAGVMYLYRKNEEEYLNWLETIKDAKYELSEFYRLSNTTDPLERMNIEIYKQIDSWDAYKSSVEDAGNALRDTLSKLGDVKPLKEYVDYSFDEGSIYNKAEIRSIEKLVKNDKDFGSLIRSTYPKEFEQFIDKNRDRLTKGFKGSGYDDFLTYQTSVFAKETDILKNLKNNEVNIKNSSEFITAISELSKVFREIKDYDIESALKEYVRTNNISNVTIKNLDKQGKYQRFDKLKSEIDKLKDKIDQNIIDDFIKYLDYTGLGQDSFSRVAAQKLGFNFEGEFIGFKKLMSSTTKFGGKLNDLLTLNRKYTTETFNAINESFESWADLVSNMNSRTKYYEKEISKNIEKQMMGMSNYGLNAILSDSYDFNNSKSFVTKKIYNEIKHYHEKVAGLDGNFNITDKTIEAYGLLKADVEERDRTVNTFKNSLDKARNNMGEKLKELFKDVEIQYDDYGNITKESIEKIAEIISDGNREYNIGDLEKDTRKSSEYLRDFDSVYKDIKEKLSIATTLEGVEYDKKINEAFDMFGKNTEKEKKEGEEKKRKTGFEIDKEIIRKYTDTIKTLSSTTGIDSIRIFEYLNGSKSILTTDEYKKFNEAYKGEYKNNVDTFLNAMVDESQKNASEFISGISLKKAIKGGFFAVVKDLFTKNQKIDLDKEIIEQWNKEAERQKNRSYEEGVKRQRINQVDFDKFKQTYEYAFSNDKYSDYMRQMISLDAEMKKLNIERDDIIKQSAGLVGLETTDVINKRNELSGKMDKINLSEAENYLAQIKATVAYIQSDTEQMRKNSDIQFKYKTSELNMGNVVYGDIAPIYYSIKDIGLKYDKLMKEREYIEMNYKANSSITGNEQEALRKYNEEITNNEISLYELRIELLEKEKELVKRNVGSAVDLIIKKMKGERLEIDSQQAKEDLTNSITSLILGKKAEEIKKPEISLLESQLSEAIKANAHLDELKNKMSQVMEGLKASGVIKDLPSVKDTKPSDNVKNSMLLSKDNKPAYDKLKSVAGKIKGNVYENMAKLVVTKPDDKSDYRVNEELLSKIAKGEYSNAQLKEMISKSTLSGKDLKDASSIFYTAYDTSSFTRLSLGKSKYNIQDKNNKDDNKYAYSYNSDSKNINTAVDRFLLLMKSLNALSVIWQDIKNVKFKEEIEELKKDYADQNRKAEYDIELSSTNSEKLEKEMELDVQKLKQDMNIEVLEEENALENEVVAFHQDFITKTSEMLQYMQAMSENMQLASGYNIAPSQSNIGGSDIWSMLASGAKTIGSKIFSSGSNANSGLVSFGDAIGDIEVYDAVHDLNPGSYNTGLTLSGADYYSFNNLDSSGVPTNMNFGDMSLEIGDYGKSLISTTPNSAGVYSNAALVSAGLNMLPGLLSGDLSSTMSSLGTIGSLLTKDPVTNFLGISSATGNLVGGSLGAASGGFNIGQMLASGKLDAMSLGTTAMGLYGSASALGSLSSTSIVGSLGSMFGLGTAGATTAGATAGAGAAAGTAGATTAGLAAGALAAGAIALPLAAIGYISYKNSKDKAKYRAAQKYNEELAKLQEEAYQNQLKALKTERRSMTQSAAQSYSGVGQSEALKRALAGASLTATSNESYKDYQVSYRRGLFGRRRRTWVLGNASATANISDFGYNSISNISDTYSLMNSMRDKMSELNEYLNSRNADAGDVNMRKDWAQNKAMLEAVQMLYDQIKELGETITKSTTALNQSFFGFETIGLNANGSEAASDEDIVKYDIGSWEKREDILNNFITDFMDASKTVGETISEIFMTGVTNAFVKNNSALNSAVNKLEEAFKNIGSAYINTDQLMESAYYELGISMDTEDSYSYILEKMKQYNMGDSNFFSTANNMLASGSISELSDYIEQYLNNGSFGFLKIAKKNHLLNMLSNSDKNFETDKSVYVDILNQLKEAGYGTEEEILNAEKMIDSGLWKNFVEYIEVIISKGNNKVFNVSELIDATKELESAQKELSEQMRGFINDWISGGGNLSDIIDQMDNLISRSANIVADLVGGGSIEASFESFSDIISEKILPEIQDTVIDNMATNILEISDYIGNATDKITEGIFTSNDSKNLVNNIGKLFDIMSNPTNNLNEALDLVGDDGLQKILAYKNMIEDINQALYERMTIDEKISENQSKINEEVSKYKTEIIKNNFATIDFNAKLSENANKSYNDMFNEALNSTDKNGVKNFGEDLIPDELKAMMDNKGNLNVDLGKVDVSSLEKLLQNILATGKEIPEELKQAIEAANGSYGTLNSTIKELEQNLIDSKEASRVFTQDWFNGLIDGTYSTIRDNLSEETQSMLDSIMEAFSSSSWETSATNIGSSLASSIISAYSEKLLDSQEMKSLASSLNDLLNDSLRGIESTSSLNFDTIYQMSNQAQKIAIEAESNRQRLEAIQSMFDYEKEITYSQFEKDISYQTSSTKESVYNITNNNTFNTSGIISSSGDMTMMANALAPYIIEAMRNYGY